MFFASRRLATVVVIGTGIIWIALIATIISMSVNHDLPHEVHPLYSLGLNSLSGLFLTAVNVGIGHHLLAAIRRMPAKVAAQVNEAAKLDQYAAGYRAGAGERTGNVVQLAPRG